MIEYSEKSLNGYTFIDLFCYINITLSGKPNKINTLKGFFIAKHQKYKSI